MSNQLRYEIVINYPDCKETYWVEDSEVDRQSEIFSLPANQ